ncbi:MAG TPA: type II toxin-antitoxin system RelE/ParE family toxin [Longimicrobiaceae bacterium]|nr:type II toxin-antitoxin system RelE/ParE family toxin [Longimicrobiaceae bacterium]
MFVANGPEARGIRFVHMALFERTRKGVLTDEEVRQVEEDLLKNPEAGVVLANTGGVRKIRAARGTRGKSGGARVVYLYLRREATIYLIFAFPKNAQGSLTDAQKKHIRGVVEWIRVERQLRRRTRE